MKTATALSAIFLSVSAAPAALANETETLQISNVVPLISSLAEDTGGAERIESAEYLRVYTQEVAAAACYLFNDVEMDLSAKMLNETVTGFDKHLDALLNGNEALGIIGGEQKRKTIAKLEEIKTSWAPISTAAQALLEDPENRDAVAVIKAGNMPLFEKTHILVSDMEAEYSNPAELMQSDVITLEIVGRQAMMSQKIAKYACQIFTGDTSEQVLKGFRDSIGLYEISLDALINGMPQVGIQPAPTSEIATSLTDVLEDWKEMRPALDALLEGQASSRDQQVSLYTHMVDEMHKLEEIAHLYVEYSKH